MPQVTQVELEGTTVECQDNKKSCEAKLLPATSDAQGIASVAPHVCHNSGEGTSFLVLAPVGMPAALNQP